MNDLGCNPQLSIATKVKIAANLVDKPEWGVVLLLHAGVSSFDVRTEEHVWSAGNIEYRVAQEYATLIGGYEELVKHVKIVKIP